MLLRVDKTTTTKAVKKLIEISYVQKERDESDQRAWRLFPTERALNTYTEVIAAENQLIGYCFNGFSDQEKSVASQLLARMRDNISHEWILNHIPMDKDILRKWLKSGYVETGRLFPTDLGSPQGSAISPTICNMVLDGLEIQIKKKYHKTKRDGKAYFPKVNFIRYADDFIVTGESRELLEAGVLPIIREFLSERGFELSEEKTVIPHIEDGFD